MKKICIYAVVLYSALIVCSSCNSDAKGTIYEGYTSNVGVSFPSAQCSVEMQASDNGVLNVPVFRANNLNDASVKMVLDDATVSGGLFTLSTSNVDFKAGESLAYAKIKYDLSKVDAMSTYTINLSFADVNQQSPSAIKSFKLITKRKLTWKSLGLCTYFDAINEAENQRKIEKAEEGNIYRIIDAIYASYPISFALSDDGTRVVSYPTQSSGYKASAGMLLYKFVSAKVTGKRIDFVLDGVFGTTVKYPGLTEYVILP